ncbi:MAG: amidohydrolase [Bacteroidales bacterium]|nr:amidohydrolase [Bacteroidales bacterium]
MKKNEKPNVFYDIHMHAFTLNHAGIIAYLNRSLINNGVSLNDLFSKSFFVNILSLLLYKSSSSNEKTGGKKLSFSKILKIVLVIIACCLFIEGWWLIFYKSQQGLEFAKLSLIQNPLILFAGIVLVLLLSLIILKKKSFSKIKTLLLFALSAFVIAVIASSLVYYFTFLTDFDFSYKTILVETLYKLWVFISFLAAAIIALAVLVVPSLLKFSKKADSFVSDNLGKALNLFSYMENDIATQFYTIEDELKYYDANSNLKQSQQSIKEKKAEGRKSNFEILDYSYKKVILTPLIMDFGYKGKDDFSQVFYNSSPVKPVLTQLVDLYLGIGEYTKNKDYNLLEIYPFLGINPINYLAKDEEEKHGKIRLERLLNKYFSSKLIDDSFEEENRYRLFRNRYENLKLDNLLDTKPENKIKIHSVDDGSIYKNLFCGIKLYPPLGFNPWPDKNPKELEKNCELYDLCEKYKIPITSHCNNGGWTIAEAEKVESYTNPKIWEKVLAKFPDLKINFAHFGGNGKGSLGFDEKRQKEILKLIGNYNNVYTDISCIFNTKEKISYLYNLIESENSKYEKNLEDRILFGTDFPMILSAQTKNYVDYIKVFMDNTKPELIEKFTLQNPEIFLWNQKIESYE